MTTERELFPELVDKQRIRMSEGFRYEEDIISEANEAALAKFLSTLDLKPFEFHGHLGNRRVTSFGLGYDYARRAVKVTDGFPAFVADLRNKVAKFAGRKVDEFQQGGVNEYPPGLGSAGIRTSQFGVIVGVSFLAPATMRFRRAEGGGWIRASQRLEPRSIYILEGEVRTAWEHSVPPVDALRYSLTFRTVAEGFTLDIEKLSIS